MLEWARNMMIEGTFQRGDHREFLELTVVYLGGVVMRPRSNGRPPAIGFKMQKPGSTNQTRSMGIALHEMKIGMMMMDRQYQQTALERRQSKALCEYLSLIYAPYFLQAQCAVSAPRLDLKLWLDLEEYKALFARGSMEARMIDAAILSLSRHTWYLTEELVIFAL